MDHEDNKILLFQRARATVKELLFVCIMANIGDGQPNKAIYDQTFTEFNDLNRCPRTMNEYLDRKAVQFMKLLKIEFLEDYKVWHRDKNRKVNKILVEMIKNDKKLSGDEKINPDDYSAYSELTRELSDEFEGELSQSIYDKAGEFVLKLFPSQRIRESVGTNAHNFIEGREYLNEQSYELLEKFIIFWYDHQNELDDYSSEDEEEIFL